MSAANGERPPLWPEPDDAAIADARAKVPSGEIYQLRAGPEVFIVRAPTKGEFDRFGSLSGDEKQRVRAIQVIARDCVVYPDAHLLSEALTRWPGLGVRIGDKVLELARMTEELEAKPL